MDNDEKLREQLAVELYKAYAKKKIKLHDDEQSQNFARMVDKATRNHNLILRGGILGTLLFDIGFSV